VGIKDSGLLDRLLEQYIPATSIVDVAQLIVVDRVAQSSGDLDDAAASFGAAVAVQDSMPYMEPPYWYYPIRQSLGAIQLAQGNATEVERTFRKSLDNYRNNALSFYGLMEAQRALGRDVTNTEKLFRESCAGKAEEPNLNRL
jgi:tetratricopeptide (TPR) repeat protein